MIVSSIAPRKGTSLLELLVVAAMISGLLLTTATVMTGFVYRTATDLQLERTERSANRVMAEFSASISSAVSYAIYPQFANWQTSSPSTQGNFILVTQPNGTQTGFAFDSGEIQIIQLSTGTRLICHRQASTEFSFASMTDGIPTLAWSISLPTEQVSFRCNAQPLYMQ